MNHNKQNNRNKGWRRHLLSILICVALVVLIVLVAVNFDAIKRAFKFSEGDSGSRTEVFYYSANRENAYAAVGEGLALASPSGVQYFSGDGERTVSAAAQMSDPALDYQNELIVAYDIGGYKIRVMDTNKILFSDELDERIVDLSVGAGGFFAVSTQELGYKGSVTVYDQSYEPAFKWFSGSGYVLCAALSPNNQKMAVASADSQGGKVQFLSLDSEAEGPSFSVDGSLILELSFISDNVLAAVGEQAVYFLNTEGELLSQYDFSGAYLQNFSTKGSGFLTLHLSDRSGLEGRLVTLDEDGTRVHELPVTEEIINVSAAGEYIGVLYGDKLVIYTSDLGSYATSGGVSGASQILVREDGTAILISTYSASLYIP